MNEASTEHGFGVVRDAEPTDDLVEKLAHAIREGYSGGWEHSTEQNQKLARKDAKNILAELAKMPVELPTDDEYAEKLADAWVRADGGENAKEDEILATRSERGKGDLSRGRTFGARKTHGRATLGASWRRKGTAGRFDGVSRRRGKGRKSARSACVTSM